MTKKEQIDKIKKSLVVCVGDSCEGCAYHDNLTCIDTLKNDARKCIIKQEKEIEKLKDELKQLKTNSKILARGVRDLNHENYKLTEKIKQTHEQRVKEINQLKTECTLLDDELRNARQETINVLNKLKEKFKGYEAWYYDGTEESYHDLEEEIDEFIKELINNAKNKN